MRLSISTTSTSSFSYKRYAYLGRTIGRCLSSAAVPFLRENAVQVPVGSNGNITLTVLSPKKETKSNSSNLILYLPPGPLFDRSQYTKGHGSTGTTSTSNCSSAAKQNNFTFLPEENLAVTTLCTTVVVKYRLGRIQAAGIRKTYRYPTPVHDTLAGLDWAKNEFQPDNVFVFGRYIGGSLALMLALTESRGLKGVAAEEPICDWVGLDDYCITDIEKAAPDTEKPETEQDKELSRKRGRKKKEPLPTPADLVPLLDARRRLFATPEKYFDSFASPTLFLRTSGKYIPLTFPTYLTGPGYPTPVLKRQPKTEADALYMTDLLSSSPSANSPSTDGSENMSDSGPSLTSLIKPVRKRKVLSRWPPSGLDYGLEAYEAQNRWVKREETVLPDVQIFVRDEDLYAEELENQDKATSLDGSINTQMEALKLDGYSNGREMGQNSQSKSKPRATTRFRGSLRDIGSINGNTVLARQGKEMVSLMRNVCFWGRKQEAAEQCVKLVPMLPPDADHIAGSSGNETAYSAPNEVRPVEVQAGHRFMEILQESKQE
ncbi:Alpha/Beta hydrolase fold [Trichophyton rubrum]|nr:Alpha/Beta hydrolase fold [Trichophyton rubrum]